MVTSVANCTVSSVPASILLAILWTIFRIAYRHNSTFLHYGKMYFASHSSNLYESRRGWAEGCKIYGIRVSGRAPNCRRQWIEKRPNLKVLIISGSHEKDLPPEARGHDFGLIKPVDMKLILEK